MSIYYEDDYSPCQVQCLLCLCTKNLKQANQNSFHKICSDCFENIKNSSGPENNLGCKSSCNICSSLIKVIFSMPLQDDQLKPLEQKSNPVSLPSATINPPQPSYSTVQAISLSAPSAPSTAFSHSNTSSSPNYSTNPAASIAKSGKFPVIPAVPNVPTVPNAPNSSKALAQANYPSPSLKTADSNAPNSTLASLPPSNPGFTQQSANKTIAKAGQGSRAVQPVRPGRPANQKYFNCEHHYCESCKNKVQGCVVCKIEVEGRCVACNRNSRFSKLGDYWACEYCGKTSLECIACQNFDVLSPDELCMSCSCSWSGGVVCDKNHKFCMRCVKKMSNICFLCTGDQSFKCKFCKTIDILCHNSVCPYCYSRSKASYCVLCKQP